MTYPPLPATFSGCDQRWFWQPNNPCSYHCGWHRNRRSSPISSISWRKLRRSFSYSWLDKDRFPKYNAVDIALLQPSSCEWPPTHTVVKYDRRIAVYTTDFGTEILSVPTEGKSLFLWDCDILGCLPRLESLLSESPLLVQCIYIYSTVSTSLQTYEAECSVADYIIYMCSTFTRLHDNIVMYGVL